VIDQLNVALASRYSVEKEIGRGGMASVWLARDLRHERQVAIKVLHPELAGAIGIDRFLREIRVTAKLSHPGIIPVLDSGTLKAADGQELPWYAMTYVPGESLRTKLDREGQLPIDEALRITREAATVLAAAHREGIIHRDIKPENILLSGGHVFVADFGLARALADSDSSRLTRSGMAVGTPQYMSPEQVSGDVLETRVDQYARERPLRDALRRTAVHRLQRAGDHEPPPRRSSEAHSPGAFNRDRVDGNRCAQGAREGARGPVRGRRVFCGRPREHGAQSTGHGNSTLRRAGDPPGPPPGWMADVPWAVTHP
jgi:serine/threonine protein kinase